MVNNDDLFRNDLLKVLELVRNPTKENLRCAEVLLVSLAGKDELPAKEITIKGIMMSPDDITVIMSDIWEKYNK